MLIGRDGEARRIAELIAAGRSRGGALVVTGEPGIGKSALLWHAASSARDAGRLVLGATGVQAEARVPFAGLHQVLDPVLGLIDRVNPTQRTTLLRAFGLAPGSVPQRLHIALAALSLVVAAAQELPVVAVIDDIHRLDELSLETLAILARRVDAHPVVVIAALPGSGLGLGPLAGLPSLQLGELDDEASRALLSQASARLRSAEREWVLHQARGHPLALVELSRALSRTGAAQPAPPPPSWVPSTGRLATAFTAGVAGLPALSRDALLVAAVHEDGELPEILAAASVLTEQRLGTEVLEPAARAGLIRFDERHVHFRHPLVRSGVLQAETITRRQAAGAALASVLRRDPRRSVWYRAQAIVGPDDEVADLLEQSWSHGADVTSAGAALERAAQLTSDPAKRLRRLLDAAEQGCAAGRPDIVDRLLVAASRRPMGELDRARTQWLREAFHDGTPSNAARVYELCETAFRSASAGERDLALDLLVAAALRCWWADTGAEARSRVATVVELLAGAEGDPRYPAAMALAEPVERAGRVDALLSRVRIETVQDADALRVLGMAAHAVGDYTRAADLLDRSAPVLRERGRLGHLTQVLCLQAAVRVELGDWARAAAAIDEGRRLAERTAQPLWSAAALIEDARVRGLRGELEPALALATRAEEPANRDRFNGLLARLQLARAGAWVAAGEYAEAYPLLRRLFDPQDPAYHQRERFSAVMFLAEAAVHVDRRADAQAVVDELEQVAATTPSPLLHVQLSYARAVLADPADAEGLLTAALDQDLHRWPWVRARLELAYGRSLRRQRRIAESRLPLRSAEVTLDAIGAPTWAEQARSELRAAGVRPSAGVRADLPALSPQELRIARLAAQGLTNREIGQRLFISPRTVGSHLYRIYPKLEITARAQLVGRLGRPPDA